MVLPVRRNHDDRPAPRDPGMGRWNAFEEFERLNRQLSSYLESLPGLPSMVPTMIDGAFTPLADVEEANDAYVVEIELPGVKRDDVDIEVAGRRVTVQGERKEKERVGILRRRQRTVGRFHYEVILPGDVDEGGVEAHLDEGVLTVRLPKPESERPRRIEVR